jgi:hypothetical protein
MLGPDITLVETPYDVEEAERRITASGYPGASRFLRTLRLPPDPEEIVSDAELRHFSD